MKNDSRNNDTALVVNDIVKHFAPSRGQGSIKQAFTGLFKRSGKKELDPVYKVLRGISFEVKKGEFLGIIGRNGSGKSTLLKMIAGVYTPTKGLIHVNGKLVPFIELGVGFNPELSGRDNVFLNGALLGFSRDELASMYDEIVSFAELEEHMDVKLKNFSSGMQVRLAFSIAIKAQSDVLLIDEVLAVGDAAFQEKCFDYFRQLKEQQKTVIFVSHDVGSLRQYCDRGILIEKGQIISEGKIDGVVNDYLQLFNTDVDKTVKNNKRWGDYRAVIKDPKIKLSDGEVLVSYTVEAKSDIEDPICGIIIKNADNISIIDSNTKWKKVDTGNLKSGKQLKLEWNIPHVFKTGKYRVTMAVAHSDGFKFYDWQEDAIEFRITKSEVTAGLIAAGDRITIVRT